MESGEQQGKLLLRFACGTLVFTREFLQSCSKELESVEPDQVFCESLDGTFKDFGNGFYAYRKQSEGEQTLVLKCTVGDVVFRVYCPISSDKAMCIPEQLESPHIEREPLLRAQVPCISGYTMLSDGTAMIPLDNLCRQASERLFDNEKAAFCHVDAVERGYSSDVTSRYLFLYPNQTQAMPKSELCHLSLTFRCNRTGSERKLNICLDFSRFSSLFTSRISLPLDTLCFGQQALTECTPPLSSPIAFVESVFCLDCRQFLIPQSDGSFVDQSGRLSPSLTRSYVYSICDGVEYVATGIAVAHSSSQIQITPHQRHIRAEYSK